jgi:hypothetical protein
MRRLRSTTLAITVYVPRIVLAEKLVKLSMLDRLNCFISITPNTVQNSVCMVPNKLPSRR